MEFRSTPGTVIPRVGAALSIQSSLANKLGDWELFAAAVASNSTRDMFIKDLATWINKTPTNRPMTDLYETSTGE